MFEKYDPFYPELYSLLLVIKSSFAHIFSYLQEIIESGECEVVDCLLSLSCIGVHCHLDKIFRDADFDVGYNIARQKIENNFDEFLRNGSGYILDRVDLVSVHIAGYDLSPQTSSKDQREQEQEEFEETL